MQMLKFENSFWDNPGAGHQPRYERGPQSLYEKLEQGSAECDELLSFFRDRAAIEETYATNLRQLSERQLTLAGFDRDEGATLKTAFRGLISECVAMAGAHADLALELQTTCIAPLRSFSNEHRARVRASWKLIDDTVRRASGELSQVDRNHRVYKQKAAAAEEMRMRENPRMQSPGEEPPAEFEVKSRLSMGVLAAEADAAAAAAAVSATQPPVDNEAAQRFLLTRSSITSPLPPAHGGALDVASILLGNIALTRHEFHVMLQRMQKEVPQHDVKFGILGTFRGLISGESLAGWWCTNYPTVVRNEADAVSVGQSMMDQGYLRFMGRGSQFQSRANGYYQWKKPALDFQSDDDYDSDDDQPLSNRTSTNLGRAAMSYERAQREADEASQVYRDSVVRAELVRTDLEEQLINYLDTMEVWELNRLINVKTMLAEYARIHKMPVQAELAIGDRLEVYEESLKPQQDIQWTIEHYGTGRFTPRPIIFRPFGLSPAEYQIFGVSLDEQLLVSHKDIPLFPAKALSAIRKATLDMAPEDRYKVWTTRALLRNIHEMRNSVNRGSKVTLKQLRQFELPVVANVLVLYFLELPMPLCPEELHGPLRALYSSASEKSTEDTLDTIRGLLKGVSYAHLKTLQTLFFTLSEQVKDDTDAEARKAFIRDISMRLGPVILRGREIVGVSVSRVPQIFATDLIEHYDELLGGIDVQRPVKLSVRPNKGDIAYEDSQLAHDMDQAHLTSGASANATAVAPSSATAALAAVAAAASVVSPRASLDTPTSAFNRLSSASARSANAPNDKLAATAAAAPASAGNRASISSNGSRSQLAVTPNTSDTVKTHTSFDDDEMLVDNILEETDGAAAGEDNMDFFLKDEDSDGTDDEDGDNEDDDAVDGGKNI